MAIHELNNGKNNSNNGSKNDRTNDRVEDARRYEKDRLDEAVESYASFADNTANIFNHTNNSSIAAKFKEYAENYLKVLIANKKNLQMKVFALDGLKSSAVFITSEYTVEGELQVIAHPVVIYDLKDYPQAERVKGYNRDLENYTSHDLWVEVVYEEVFRNRAKQAYSTNFGIPLTDFNFSVVGGTSLDVNTPALNNIENDVIKKSAELDTIVYQVATFADGYKSWGNNEDDSFVKPEFNRPDTYLAADVYMVGSTGMLANSVPVAEDITLTVYTEKDRGYGRDDRKKYLDDYNTGSSTGESGVIGTVGVGIEGIYVATKPTRDGDIAQCIVPEAIIRNIDLSTRKPSFGLILQMVSAAGITCAPNGSDDPLFYDIFMGENMRDNQARNIGGLYPFVESKDGSYPRKVFRPNTEKREIYNAFDDIFNTSLRFGIDVPSQGPSTTMTRFFLFAAKYACTGDRHYKIYNDALLEAADYLTDGEFSEVWGDEPIMVDEINVVPGGYFYDENGLCRDIREINLYYLANLADSANAADLAMEYASTFLDGLQPEEALHRRISIINEVQPNWVHTDNICRVYFHDDFLEELNRILQRKQLDITTNFRSGVGRRNRRRNINEMRGLMSNRELSSAYRSSGRFSSRHRGSIDDGYRNYGVRNSRPR